MIGNAPPSPLDSGQPFDVPTVSPADASCGTATDRPAEASYGTATDRPPASSAPAIYRAPIPIGPDSDFLRPPPTSRKSGSSRVPPPVPARVPTLVESNTNTLSTWLDNLPTMSWDFPDSVSS